MKVLVDFIGLCTLMLICYFPKNAFGQASQNFKQNKKTYNQLVKVFKNNPVLAVDSTTNTLGVYEKLLQPYLDIDEINKKFNVADSNSFFSPQAIFTLQQMFLATLHSYIKFFPPKYLKIIPYYQSATLNSNWRKDSNAEEISEIENSIMFIIKNKKKSYHFMLLTFNKKNNKLLYLSPMGMPVEAIDFINKINKAK